ncbi:MAG: NADP-dependent oxidoreductase [Gemmatimonadaceae bacterium]
MKALAIRRYGARTEMMELPRPVPGKGELLVRVRAAGVNPLDYKIRDGAVKVLLPFSFPLILGTDLAGDVEAIGPGVTKFGAQVATTASAKNRALVRALGADVAIDYKTSRFEAVVKDQDVVLDTQGGDTLLRSFDVVKPGGVVVTLGGRPDAKFARAWGLSLPLIWILGFLNRKVDRLTRERHVRFEYLFMRSSGEQLDRIGALVEQSVIQPVLDKVFPFEAAAEAISYVESGRAVGKVVIRVAD